VGEGTVVLMTIPWWDEGAQGGEEGTWS
jgi:hypothetical protein